MDGGGGVLRRDLVLPGNEVPAKAIRSILRSGRIANAYLFRGPGGSPKEEFALRFAAGLLCDSRDVAETGEPCGRCWSCRAVVGRSHPDLYEVEKEGSTIKIRKSHEILQDAISSPYHSTRKVFIVRDAEHLTLEASNALLKILEEPPQHVVFILTGENLVALPETVVSRCQVVPFRKTPSSVIADILVRSHGVDAQDARTIASFADGDLDRALRILKRHWGVSSDGKVTLRRVLGESPVRLALEYAKLDRQERLEVLSDLEIELVLDLRDRIFGLDSDGESASKADGRLRRTYVALRSLLQARGRLEANTNAFLAFAVLFMDISHVLKGTMGEKG